MARRWRDSLVTAGCRLLAVPFREACKEWPAGFVPQRILILRLCCLGDVLFSTALLETLHKAFPEAHITYAVGNWSSRMVEGNPNVDEVLNLGSVVAGKVSLMEAWRLSSQLGRGKFDACFVLERSPLLSFVPYLAGIPHRVGLDSANRGFSLNVRVPVEPRRHEAELFLDAARAIGVQPESPHLSFYPTDLEREHVQTVLRSRRVPLRRKSGVVLPGSRDPVVVVHPGGGSNPGMTFAAKRWPADRFGTLVDRLVDEMGAWVLLVGSGRDDREAVNGVKAASRRYSLTGSRVLDLADQMDVGQLGALYEQSDLFIGNDTGPMHLAVATGLPVVALFGPSDEVAYGPYHGQSRTVVAPVDCRPCFERGSFTSACKHRCMEEITVERVWEEARALLAAPAAAQP